MAATYNINGIQTSQMSTRIKLRAFLTIFGGLLILLALGAHHTFGNMMPYLISYLKYRAGELNINNVDSLWFTATGPPLQVVAFVLGGILYRKCGARITAAIGAVIYRATFLTYFTVQKSFIALTFTQSVLTAFGSAIAYGTPLAAAMRWFPARSGLVGGIIVAGYGGSASIFNQVITFYINPNNLSADVKEGTERYFSHEALLNRVPTCYLVLGGTCAAMQIIGVLLLFSPPLSDENKPETVIRMDQTINTNSEEEGTPQNKDADISVRNNSSDKEETNTKLINGEASVKDSSIGNHILVSQAKSIVGTEKGDAKNDTLSSEGNTKTESMVFS